MFGYPDKTKLNIRLELKNVKATSTRKDTISYWPLTNNALCTTKKMHCEILLKKSDVQYIMSVNNVLYNLLLCQVTNTSICWLD